MPDPEPRNQEHSAPGSADDGLCLAFVNTMAWRRSQAPEERLPSPEALLRWCVDAKILTVAGAANLERRWQDRPDEALGLHAAALALRETIYGLLRSRIAGQAVGKDDLDRFNSLFETMPPRLGLARDGRVLGWRHGPRRGGVAGLLAPIAWSAADLVTCTRAGRVRQCDDPDGCGWLFLDESRAGTRRWCSMGDCGNRAKARRHQSRRKLDRH